MIAYAGKLLVHAVRALLVCWQRMLRLGLSVGVLSGLIALVFGAYVTRAFPPAPLTWVAAMFFGFALGYAAAMTVLADEMLLSVVEAVRVLEGDVKAGLRAAAVAAEREAGEAGRGIMRFLGHPRPTPDAPRTPSTPSTPGTSATAPSRAPSSQPLMTLSSVERHDPGRDQANETLAAIAATESFINTTPRPAVNARPVRADQLPRIGWANQDDATGARVGAQPAAPEVAIAAPAPALAEMPPLPIRTLRSQPREETLPPASGPEGRGESEGQDDAATQPDVDVEMETEPVGMPAIQQNGATQPAGANEAVGVAAAPAETQTIAAEASAEVPEAVPAGSDVATDTDQPVMPAEQPAETGREERGIWARIGQALIGNTTVPLRETNTAGNASSQSETSQP